MGIRNTLDRQLLAVERDLTTPHGDQEHGATDVLPAERRDHLTTPHGDQEPPSQSRPRAARPRPHYPSWGSGTLNSHSWLPRSHYPSWGSGTGHHRDPVRRRSDLTTPHGDQEHHAPDRGRAPPEVSLPLMGIRNDDAVLRMVGRPRLTTPHGDQEHRGRPSSAPCIALTTPHGDQELSGSPTTSRPATSHYPSWGSGTTTGR